MGPWGLRVGEGFIPPLGPLRPPPQRGRLPPLTEQGEPAWVSPLLARFGVVMLPSAWPPLLGRGCRSLLAPWDAPCLPLGRVRQGRAG